MDAGAAISSLVALIGGRFVPKWTLPGSQPASSPAKYRLAFADEDQLAVADLATGEVLSIHLIEPGKT